MFLEYDDWKKRKGVPNDLALTQSFASPSKNLNPGLILEQGRTNVHTETVLLESALRAIVARIKGVWDDPDLAVDWPITDERLALSARDRANPTLAEHLSAAR